MLLNIVSDIDNCNPNNPCQNDGVCTDAISSYTCDCLHGFKGDNCTISMLNNYLRHRQICIKSIFLQKTLLKNLVLVYFQILMTARIIPATMVEHAKTVLRHILVLVPMDLPEQIVK